MKTYWIKIVADGVQHEQLISDAGDLEILKTVFSKIERGAKKSLESESPESQTGEIEKGISEEYWKKTFDGLKTEINASKILGKPDDSYKLAFNIAMDKALTFVKMYEKKEGLFQ